MRKLLIAGLLLMACTHQVQAQTEVNNYVPGLSQDGVNYFLPKTALRITVVAEKTVTEPGELNKYAFRYLRMQDVPTQTSTVWTIKSIAMDPYGVPDNTKAYNIKLKSKTSAPLVSLTRDGILLSINTETAEHPLSPLPAAVPAPAPLNAKQYMSQEILSAGSTAKMAELCAQEIYDIRESRNALVRGEADNTPKDGEQLRLMLDQLATQDQALTQLFAGSVSTSTEVFSLTYLPTEETEKDILFRFSQFSGVVDKDDLSGEPVFIAVASAGALPPKAEPNSKKKGKFFSIFKKGKSADGIYYNVPAREAITIFDVENTLLETECSMGQLGYVETMSPALFNKKPTTKVTFFQETGGVKNLEQ